MKKLVFIQCILTTTKVKFKIKEFPVKKSGDKYILKTPFELRTYVAVRELNDIWGNEENDILSSYVWCEKKNIKKAKKKCIEALKNNITELQDRISYHEREILNLKNRIKHLQSI
jgi:hypothetical protein